MNRKLVLPLIAAAGILFAGTTVAASYRPVPAVIPSAPAESPFAASIAGSGIVEASTRNVEIAAPASRIVLEVPVKVGSDVLEGDLLFRLDDRDLKAKRASKASALAVAKAKLARFRAMPRLEQLPTLEARVASAKAAFEDARDQSERVQQLSSGVVSDEEKVRRRHAANAAEAKLREAEAELALCKAGAWEPDVEVAEADVQAAQADLAEIETEIGRMAVKAPFAGKVLQVNARIGELPSAAAPVILGAVETLHLRVDVDENDAWRFRTGARARASLRGNAGLTVDLAFEYEEPYLVPKKFLTGDSQERIDTRVLQVVFSFAPDGRPIRVGQQMDVYIEAPSSEVKP